MSDLADPCTCGAKVGPLLDRSHTCCLAGGHMPPHVCWCGAVFILLEPLQDGMQTAEVNR